MAKKAQAKKTKKPALKRKSKTKLTAKPAPKGMWKILEFKMAQQKAAEKDRPHDRIYGASHPSLQRNKRNSQFARFAGPRRKAG